MRRIIPVPLMALPHEPVNCMVIGSGSSGTTLGGGAHCTTTTRMAAAQHKMTTDIIMSTTHDRRDSREILHIVVYV